MLRDVTYSMTGTGQPAVRVGSSAAGASSQLFFAHNATDGQASVLTSILVSLVHVAVCLGLALPLVQLGVHACNGEDRRWQIERIEVTARIPLSAKSIDECAHTDSLPCVSWPLVAAQAGQIMRVSAALAHIWQKSLTVRAGMQ